MPSSLDLQPVPLILVQNDDYWLPYALNCVKGKFNKYVIYDVGSKDLTRDILEDFISEESERADVFFRFLPDCPPVVQGAFRNSMFAEARAEWVFVLDADEVYNAEDVSRIVSIGGVLQEAFEQSNGAKIYGVLRRREFSADLKSCYSDLRSHHRLYHRTAIFNGTHPGEYPVVKQHEPTELYFPEVICNHFHNTKRSSLGDEAAQRRVERKTKATYHPGNLEDVDLLSLLPDLQHDLGYPKSPALQGLLK